jgi:transposase-like protein
LIKDAKSAGTPLDGVDGLLNQMTKAVIERALQAESTDHLGYDSGDPAGRGTGNSRNGTSSETVSTMNGPVEISVPQRSCGFVRAGDRAETVAADRQHRRYDLVVVFAGYDDP